MCQVQGNFTQVNGLMGGGCLSPSASRVQRDSNGRYTVYGSSSADRIRVQEQQVGARRFLDVWVNRELHRIPLDGLLAATSVGIRAGAGNDAVVVDPNVRVPLWIEGQEGNDYLKGGSGRNALLGGSGNDTLVGGPKSDLFLEGSGADRILGNDCRDSYSVSDFMSRLRQGRACANPVSRETIQEISTKPSCTVPLPPPPLPKIPVQEKKTVVLLKPFRQPDKLRPPLSQLLQIADTHDESGFSGGRDMTKNLLGQLYEGPTQLRQGLATIANAKERDDAAASFARTLLDAGPDGGRLLKELPLDIKRTLVEYVGSGNAWSSNKAGIYRTLAEVADPAFEKAIANGSPLTLNGRSLKTGFNDQNTIQFHQRYRQTLEAA